MNKVLRILLLEDRSTDAELVIRELRKEGLEFTVKIVTTEAEFLAAIGKPDVDLILSDYTLPGYDGTSALAAAQKKCPAVPFIFVSGSIGEEFAIDALHYGATDYVLKQRMTRLGPAVRRALQEVEEHAQREQTEEALRQSEHRFRAIFDSIADAIFIHDIETGLVLDVNRAVLEMYGCTYAEAMDPKRREIGNAPPAYGDAVATQLMQKAVINGPQIFEWLSVRKSGEKFWTEVVLKKIMLDGKDRMLVVVRDISRRRQTEAEVQRLAMAVEQAAETIVITDLQGTILYANPAFEKTSGYSRSEVLGQNTRILKSGKQDTAFYKQMWDALAHGEVWHGRFTNKRKDGTFYEEDAVISAIRDAAGAITNYVAVKRDISRELRPEQQVQQAQKMDAVGRLAGGVAHDFNNILQAIMGYSELLLKELPEGDRHREDVHEIHVSAKRAADLTRQLLAFSRQQLIVPAALNLNAIVTNIQKMLQRLIGEDIQLINKLQPDLPRIRADAGQIEQIIMNLAVNARDAMPQGGRLQIRTGEVAFAAQDIASLPDARPGRFVTLTVTDTGTGMSREVQSHLFEPFFSTKGPGKGTGLGLSVIYGIVKQHDGWISVYSREGQGTTFMIYLPVYAGEKLEQGPAELEAPPPTGHGERILLVEDDPEVRKLATRSLGSAGYEVLIAASGEAARTLFEQERGRFDLLFSDIVLTDGNGIELAAAFLQQKPGLPLLLTSGYTDERSRWKIIEEQKFHFLQKPYPVAALLRTVRQILDDHAPKK